MKMNITPLKILGTNHFPKPPKKNKVSPKIRFDSQNEITERNNSLRSSLLKCSNGELLGAGAFGSVSQGDIETAIKTITYKNDKEIKTIQKEIKYAKTAGDRGISPKVIYYTIDEKEQCIWIEMQKGKPYKPNERA